MDDHVGDLNNPNIMMDGGSRSAYLRNNQEKRNKDLWSSKLGLNLSAFKNRLLKFFGNKKATDNYDKNLSKQKGDHLLNFENKKPK